nr:MAG TPA: hypothetical protein [Caudoviricetes sp.]
MCRGIVVASWNCRGFSPSFPLVFPGFVMWWVSHHKSCKSV